MRINPEILRYYWLDFSLHRIIMMPIILAIIFAITILIDFSGSSAIENVHKLQFTSYYLFNLIVFIWGSYRASGAVLTDINERTWDYQRLSSLSAWTLSWGTIFGSTLYIWYGAAICLAVLILSASYTSDPASIIQMVVTMLIASLFSLCTITLLGMQALQTSNRSTRRRTIGYRFIALIAGYFIWTLSQTLASPLQQLAPQDLLLSKLAQMDIYFYGFAIAYEPFMLMTLFVFTFWSLFGVYRCMRSELKMRTTPWGWTAFLTFLILFWGGFSPRTDGVDISSLGGIFVGPINIYQFSAIALFISLLSCYAMFFSDNLSLIRYRMLFHHMKAGNFGKAWQLVPRWLVSFVFVLISSVTIIALTPYNPDIGNRAIPAPALLVLILFLTRDLAILNLFSIAEDNRRALIATLFYLSVLYGLLPLLAWSMGFRSLHWFYALTPDYSWTNMIPILVQAVIAVALVALRWKGINSNIQKL